MSLSHHKKPAAPPLVPRPAGRHPPPGPRPLYIALYVCDCPCALPSLCVSACSPYVLIDAPPPPLPPMSPYSRRIGPVFTRPIPAIPRFTFPINGEKREKFRLEKKFQLDETNYRYIVKSGKT
ncbi:Hypothetical protein NTJ_02140 [Nesidiocoris tenuis]|uniref:Uncharacterized protein n=1 Tax=Nesidiocoris tenuis TaxID=355587 RepID=A0ABN7AG77_9HEMI|nr:Hypothetical protein NTJ_02140 [Nesidiocoris tenuis]